ncbi:MAG TPA: N-acetylglucosamine-6-phosphate deacetylase, partial [Streptosporangiaceae bacterium]|nr:N-acetylglucosamine-6-phosphate deacetylase [Streptosporangiaceae bacterium]
MLIAAERVLTAEDGADPVPRPGFVEVTEAVIDRVGGGAPAAQADVMLTDGYLVPGFVDLQVNGYFGVEFQTAD